MTKKNLLDTLKNTIGRKPSVTLTDDIKQALDIYIQRNLVAIDEEQVEGPVPSFSSLSLDETAEIWSEEKEAREAVSAKPRPSLPHFDQALSGAAKEKRKEQKEPSVSYAAGNFSQSSLEDHLRNLDASFSASLLKLIDAKGMTDSECYRKAGIDRRHFSKMRNENYHPSKSTVLALCIALSLSKSEAIALLEKAGYTLSRSSVQDLIVEYFLVNRQWDIDLVNAALYEHDQPLLGF